MALTLQCFFCGRTVSVYKENEVKYVDCPGCGARINVDAETASSSGLTSTKPGSCGGCLFIFIIIIGVALYFIIEKNKEKRGEKSLQHTKESISKAYAPSESEARKEIYFIVDQMISQELKEREKLFSVALEWKEEFSSLPVLLLNILEAKKSESHLYQPKIIRNLYLKIFEQIKEEKFIDKKDFLIKVTNISRQSQKFLEEKCLEMDEKNLTRLYECLYKHLFEKKNLPENLSLQEAILKSSNFTSYELLIFPSSTQTIYWDWDIGIHYGFTKAKISQISAEKKQLMFWEKLPSKTKTKGEKNFHRVVFMDGTRAQWSMEKIKNALK